MTEWKSPEQACSYVQAYSERDESVNAAQMLLDRGEIDQGVFDSVEWGANQTYQKKYKEIMA